MPPSIPISLAFLALTAGPTRALAQDPPPGAPAPGPLERIIVSDDRTHFITADSRQRFVVWGVNYDHDSNDDRLLDDYWATQWPTVVEDFGEIRALGANVVRIHLQLARFMQSETEPDQVNLARLADLLSLAGNNGLRLDITGLGCYNKTDVPEWYDALDEARRWQVQARFWSAVADVCKDSPAVFCYNLMNEPILPGEDKPVDDWLAGDFAGKYFVQYITRDLAGRTRLEVARQWVKTLTDAIREVDNTHMITVGVIPWAQTFPGAKPIFYDKSVDGPLDFVAVHFYPKKDEVDRAIEALKVYIVGKPMIIEEMFPLSCSIEELDTFIDASRDYCDGWISFYWGKTIDQYKAGEDLQSAIMAQWLAHFKELAATR